MAEVVRVGGVDPGLRTSGFAILNYNQETNECWVSNAGVIRTPTRFKGLEALQWMTEKIEQVSKRECFLDCHKTLIEFPAAIYGGKFSGGALMPVAGVAGAASILFNNEKKDKVILAYPAQWNGRKKKATTSKMIIDLLGPANEWEFDDVPTRDVDFEHVIDAAAMAYWLMERDFFERKQ